MTYVFLIVLLPILFFILLFGYIYYKKNQVSIESNVSIFGQKNHDYRKVPHRTKSIATAELKRMKSKNYPGSERMNVYYNPERKAWFVGKSSLKKKTQPGS